MGRPVMVRAAAVDSSGENVASVTQALRGKVYLTNAVGQRILELCDGTRTVEEITRAIATEFDRQPEVVSDDVAEFLASSEETGVIEWVDD